MEGGAERGSGGRSRDTIAHMHIRKFLTAIGEDWLARMSGPLTVPFTIGAFFVPAWYRVIFACLAICAAIVTCYRVWATEYERAEVEIG